MKRQKRSLGEVRRSANNAAPRNRARHTPRDGHPTAASDAKANYSAVPTTQPGTAKTSATRDGDRLYVREDMAALGLLALPVFLVLTAVMGTVYAREKGLGRGLFLPLVKLTAQSDGRVPANSPPSILVVGYERRTRDVAQPAVLPIDAAVTKIATHSIPANLRTSDLEKARVSIDRLALTQPHLSTHLKSAAAPQSFARTPTVSARIQTQRIELTSIEAVASPAETVALTKYQIFALKVVRETMPFVPSQTNPAMTIPTWDFEDTLQVCRANNDPTRRTAAVDAISTGISATRSDRALPKGDDQTALLGLSDEDFGVGLANAAAKQLGRFVIYNEVYLPISYPMGDIPALFGVCTDVIVRALSGDWH